MEEVPMITMPQTRLSLFATNDLSELGMSAEALYLRRVQGQAYVDIHRNRALPPHLTPLSREARVAVDAGWAHVCEEMFEFLAQQFPDDFASLVCSDALTPPALTFAAEILGQSCCGSAPGRKAKAVDVLRGLLRHQNSLVREGAIYGL